MQAQEILDFWFKELKEEDWWKKDDNLDKLITKKFSNIHHNASNNILTNWRGNPLSSLAEIIILDQFSRNIYRNKKKAFAQDELALKLAKEAILKEFDKELSIIEKSFLYLPFMHSEKKGDHEIAIKLFSAKGLENNLKFEYQHKEIIDRFGRYPHRNKILRRKSTKEELEFLKGPNSSF